VVEALVVLVDHMMQAQLGIQEHQDQILYLEQLLQPEVAQGKAALRDNQLQLVDLEAVLQQFLRVLEAQVQRGKVLLAVMALMMVAMDITGVVAALRLLEPME
jgi:light-regulated signal transduction histidine kinase (bacteriophytochrome)